MGSLFLELSKQRSLLKMMEERGFTLYQQNGQRTYGGPPPNWGSRPPPSRDCEVFIGRLPRMCFEDELIPLFLTAGELYEFRLMLDFSGTNRGYGYAHYATPAGAAKAIKTLNKFEIRPGHQIGVLKSKNNCRLLFGNIGSALNVETFSEFIRTATDQVLNVLIFKSFEQLKTTDFSISAEVEEAFLGRVLRNNGNNHFAIVEYENHKAAAVARRVLIPKYGHILAIDWAVPPRERKRFGGVNDSQIPNIERPLQCTQPSLKDSGALSPKKTTSKIRPVPVLLVQPSHLDNVSFMPKTFKTVVKYFKYQLSVCLYKSVDQLEIPLFVCKEIERKIVDRITNLENCGQAVQLIFNYFSWYNEKKRCIINLEIQRLLQEVKTYADSFVHFVNKRLKYGPSPDLSEDNYYINTLPLQLSILFYIILRCDGEHQAKLSSGITRSLNWLVEVMQKGDKEFKNFVEDIVNMIVNEDSASLDKASNLAKSTFLNAIASNAQFQNLSMNSLHNSTVDLSLQNNVLSKSMETNFRATDPMMSLENFSRMNGEQESAPSKDIALDLQKISLDVDQDPLKVDDGHYVPMPFSRFGKYVGASALDSNYYPSVPLLLVQPSILNNVPFMPKIFNNVLIYFNHLIRICVNTNACQWNLPQRICSEIERKIIDRISNMENCGQGVQLILNYFSWWAERKPSDVNVEVQKLLQEVKTYADSFVQFTWNKTLSGYQPNPTVEHFFCNVLPLRLNLLFQIMLIFNSENPVRFFIGISKGLNWLEELFQKGDSTTKEFLKELTRFVLESDPSSYEKAKNLGKIVCSEIMDSNGHALSQSSGSFPLMGENKKVDKINSIGTTSNCLTSISNNFCSPKGESSISEAFSDFDC